MEMNRQKLPEISEYVRYNDNFNLGLWLCKPDQSKYHSPHPVAVFFFGGGWSVGSPEQFAPHAHYLTKHGMSAICAEYRISSKHDSTPFDSVDDAFAVMEWIQKHADKYNFDVTRIVASGGSAGGHLAATTAILPQSPDGTQNILRPSALVLFNPVLDFAPDPNDYTPEDHEQIVGVIHKYREIMGEKLIEISPMAHLHENLPPTLVMHGTADTTVPIITIKKFQERTEALGNDFLLKSYEGRTHAFFNFNDGQNPDFYNTLEAMQMFLVKHAYMDAPGNVRDFFKK